MNGNKQSPQLFTDIFYYTASQQAQLQIIKQRNLHPLSVMSPILPWGWIVLIGAEPVWNSVAKKRQPGQPEQPFGTNCNTDPQTTVPKTNYAPNTYTQQPQPTQLPTLLSSTQYVLHFQ